MMVIFVQLRHLPPNCHFLSTVKNFFKDVQTISCRMKNCKAMDDNIADGEIEKTGHYFKGGRLRSGVSKL